MVRKIVLNLGEIKVKAANRIGYYEVVGGGYPRIKKLNFNEARNIAEARSRVFARRIVNPRRRILM